MEDNLNDTHSAAGTYLYQVIKPVARILIRFGFSARNAADLIRWAYVKVFYETPEFWRYDEPTALQCSLKTGIQRSEITDLLKIDHPQSTVRTERRNRAAHILSAWINDPDFHSNGQPAELPISSPDGKSFRSLVNRYEADARYASILDDLISVGCAEQNNNWVRLVNRTYGLHGIDTEKLKLAGDMTHQLIQTTEHNLTAESIHQRRLQRFWWQRRVPADRAKEAHTLIKLIGESAGRKMDAALAELADKNQAYDTDYVEIGFGIYGYQGAGKTGEPEMTSRHGLSVREEKLH